MYSADGAVTRYVDVPCAECVTEKLVQRAKRRFLWKVSPVCLWNSMLQSATDYYAFEMAGLFLGRRD